MRVLTTSPDRFSGVAKERGDADQQIVEQLDGFAMVLLQALDIEVDVAQFEDLHAALDPPQEGAFLIAGKVVAEALDEELADCLPRLVDMIAPGAR